MATEIYRAEAVDWWNTERVRIATELEERFPLLMLTVDEKIKAMPTKALVWRKDYYKQAIEPIAREWIETEYRRHTSEIGASFSAAISPADSGDGHGLSHSDYAAIGAAAAFSVAPLAALPFVGGIVVAGSLPFVGASIAVVPAAIVGAGAVALGYGPTIRNWASSKLEQRFRVNLHREMRLRVLGDLEQSSVPSLKGALFAELDGLLRKRLEELT